MGFYDEIKDLYKKNIDTKTGLMLEEKIQLEGVIGLMKDMVKGEMLIGKNHTERRFSQNSKTAKLSIMFLVTDAVLSSQMMTSIVYSGKLAD